MTSRIAHLGALLARKKAGCFLVSNPVNVSYLVGFSTHDSYLLVACGRCFLLTDGRYTTEYANLLLRKSIELKQIEKNIFQTLNDLRRTLDITTLTFEAEHVSFAFYQKLQSLFRNSLVASYQLVEELRMIKEESEIAAIKQAIAITLKTFSHIRSILKPGITEFDVAIEIEHFIRIQGAQQAAFDIIVASGPHSSFPHAQKTNRVLKHNEPVLCDIGVDFQGYKSDLTRMFFLGKISAPLRKIHSLVKDAQERARDAIKPGVSIATIDKKARGLIAQQGFGKNFSHSLGHGVGLETHELPRITVHNKEKLRPGMVFTLEPAIYLENNFGVRIEDMVLVTEKGFCLLSKEAV